MGSMVNNRIDLNGVGALRGQRHIPSKMGGGGGGYQFSSANLDV